MIPKIIIVDDHILFRESIKLLIENEKMGEVIAVADNGKDFLFLLDDYKPDLILMDIEMPVMGGIEATKKALLKMPELRILALTMLDDKKNYISMVNAGAMGFVSKSSGKQELEKAIKIVIGGECYFSKEILRQIIMNSGKEQNIPEKQTSNNSDFTDRELEILQHLCKGLSVAEIAEKLFRSVKTIEANRSTLLEKTNTKNTINLVLYAIKNKLVDV